MNCKRFSSLLVIILMTSCSSSVMLTPPQNNDSNNEYYEFVEWQRQLSEAHTTAQVMDYFAFGALIGISVYSPSYVYGVIMGIPIVGGFHFTGQYYHKKYDQLITYGKQKGWVRF